MSDQVFGQVYADQYDCLYHDKDYEAECDFLEAMFRKMNVPVKTILDLGCGTGGHAILLAQRGYEVTGVDRSENMLAIAGAKAKAADVDVEFVGGDIRTVELGRTFDAVIAMFAVMCYQTTNTDLAAACLTARRHVDPGGVFAFDGWHGPGVLTDLPTQRVKIVQNGNRRVVRFTQPVLDVVAHTVETRFIMWVTEEERILSEVDETHMMRFLFPREVAYFLEVAGFAQVEFCPFMDLEGRLDKDCWNMMVIAEGTKRVASQ
jgi:SAM-dependent methyltransferase